MQSHCLRYGLTPKKGSPLIFVVVNGEAPVQLKTKDFAKIKDGMVSPTHCGVMSPRLGLLDDFFCFFVFVLFGFFS